MKNNKVIHKLLLLLSISLAVLLFAKVDIHAQLPNNPPVVSPISANPADADTGTPGYQVVECTTVTTYSGTASDPDGDQLNWTWYYTVNGGPRLNYFSGTGTVSPITYSHCPQAGSTFQWILSVTDGMATTESFLNVFVISAPIASPILSVIPTSLNFSTVTVGTTKDLTFTLQNAGGGTLTGNASTSAPFSIFGNNSFSLAGGQSQMITVRFSPTSAIIFNGNVSVSSNAGNASVTLTGTGTSGGTGTPPTATWTTPPPSSVTAGQNFTVAWTTAGSPTHVNVHWNPTDPLATGCCLGAVDTTDSSTVSPTASPVTLTAPTKNANGSIINSPTTVKYVVHVSNSVGSSNSTIVSVSVNPPNRIPSLTGLGQFRSNGTTAISEGGTTGQSTIVFKATVSDPDGDQVRLEIELRQITEPFTGQPTTETIGILVPSGTQVSISRPGLFAASYHWRARAMDSRGAASGWVEFGVIGNTDFTVTGQTSMVDLKIALEELRTSLVNAVERHVDRTAQVYAVAAQARINNGWLLELLRAFWAAADFVFDLITKAINTTLDLFFTLTGSAEIATDASKLQQIINGLQESRTILTNFAFVTDLIGFYRSIDDYHLFRSVTDELSVAVERRVKQSQIPGGELLAKQILTQGSGNIKSPLLIPERSGTRNGSRFETLAWSGGINPVIQSINRNFRDLIDEISRDVPPDTDFGKLVDYIRKLRDLVVASETRVVPVHFFHSLDGTNLEIRDVGLGLLSSGFQQLPLLLDALQKRVDVQYEEAWDQSIDIGLGVLTLHFSRVNFGGREQQAIRFIGDALGVLDIPGLPNKVIELINEERDPIDLTQQLAIQMTGDLAAEIARLWMLADGVAGLRRPESNKAAGGVVRYVLQGGTLP